MKLREYFTGKQEGKLRKYLNKALGFLVCLLVLGCQTVGQSGQRKFSRREAVDQWVTAEVHASNLQHRVFFSTAAKTNVSYHIYTPELYNVEKDSRFPVLYWLHGHGGGLKGIPFLVEHFDLAIRAGKMPPVIIVFPNGMFGSMWCDSKDGKVPMETVIVKELVPIIDATFRTIASREGRLVEGFSMGGYGAARLAFKYHDIFGSVSILGAGPLQQEFTESVGPKYKAHARVRTLKSVYGGDQDYFKEQSPWELVKQYATDTTHAKLHIRQVIGDGDDVLDINHDFAAHLTQLKIPYSFTVLTGIAHDTMPLLNALGNANWEFYRTVFGVKDSDNLRIVEEPLTSR